jgi:predicted DNA-binding protein (MmcQ/YjbR family)
LAKYSQIGFNRLVMINQQEVEEHLQYLADGIQPSYPFGKTMAVYKVGDEMFALVYEGSKPLKLSLRCEPRLAKLLRENYETVMAGEKLSPKHWNTVLCTGQLDEQEIKDLITHAYHQVNPVPQS